jgi:hypothetical protein
MKEHSENSIVTFSHGYGWGDEDTPKNRKERKELRKKKNEAQKAGTLFEPPPGEMSCFVMDAAVMNPSKFKGVAGSALYGLPSFANTAQHYVEQKFPESKIINFGKAWTSSTEVNAVRKRAMREGWENGEITLIVMEPHKKRVELLAKRASRRRKVKKRGLRFKVKTAESVLFDPEIYGGGDLGEQKVAEYRSQYKKIQVSEKYRKLKEQAPLAEFLTRARMDRPLNLIFLIRRPLF